MRLNVLVAGVTHALATRGAHITACMMDFNVPSPRIVIDTRTPTPHPGAWTTAQVDCMACIAARGAS